MGADGCLRLEDMTSFDGGIGVALELSHNATCVKVEVLPCSSRVYTEWKFDFWCCDVVTVVSLVACVAPRQGVSPAGIAVPILALFRKSVGWPV